VVHIDEIGSELKVLVDVEMTSFVNLEVLVVTELNGRICFVTEAGSLDLSNQLPFFKVLKYHFTVHLEVGTRAATRRLAKSPSLNSTLTTPGWES